MSVEHRATFWHTLVLAAVPLFGAGSGVTLLLTQGNTSGGHSVGGLSPAYACDERSNTLTNANRDFPASSTAANEAHGNHTSHRAATADSHSRRVCWGGDGWLA
jgi:hypothetical protein